MVPDLAVSAATEIVGSRVAGMCVAVVVEWTNGRRVQDMSDAKKTDDGADDLSRLLAVEPA